MATVVIVHAAEDALPARALAEKLREAKLDVTMEHPPGEPLREAVSNAEVTLVLWSPRATAQLEIIEDVEATRGVSKMVHALMQNAVLPDAFADEIPVNLTGWRGEDDFQPWRDLARIVTAKAGVANLPPPSERPPSGFFQAGRADADATAPRLAPRPQPAPRLEPYTGPPVEPRDGTGRGMMMALIALVALGVGGAGAYVLMSQNRGAESTSLDDVDIASPAALREFLANNPSDAEREQAREALERLEQQSLDAARDANTIEAFEQFLRDFPESEETVFVQGQIQQLRILEAEAAGQPPPEMPVGAPITELGPDPDLMPPGTMPPSTMPPDTPAPSGEGPVPLIPQPSDEGPVPLTPPPTELPAQEPPDAPS